MRRRSILWPNILRSWDSSKVIVFSWQPLLDKILTRHNPFRWRIISDPNDASYVLFEKWVELRSHIFVTCAFTYMILFLIFGSLGDRVKTKISLTSMWQYVVWFFWKYRNYLTFSKKNNGGWAGDRECQIIPVQVVCKFKIMNQIQHIEIREPSSYH